MTVHDCAARLPNGEGTRNDICELLKESQFLAPGVTDSQVCSVCLRPFSRWTWVSRYLNVSILDFVGAKDDGGGEW